MTQQNNASSNNEWTPPLPLPEGVSLLPWPSAVFPEPFEMFVQELSRATETPIELAAMVTLSTVATLAQNKYEVQVKEDYSEPLNIWTATVLPPASRKTKVYTVTTKPLRDWETEQKTLMEPTIVTLESKKKTLDARIKHLRGNAARAKNEQEFQQQQILIEELEKEIQETPAYPQIWTGDITPEHLGTIMAANGEAMAILSDEGGVFDILSGLYSDGKANIDLFLQSHAASPVRVDRGSRPPIILQRPVLTLGLTIQPHTLSTICKNKTFRGRGLLGRFLYVIPKSNIGKRKLDIPSMTAEVKIQYEKKIKSIFKHHFDSNNHPDRITKIPLNPEAYSKWLEYAKLVESLMGEEIGLLSHITDWAGKLPGAVARISGLLHVMRHADTSPMECEIVLEDMEAAVKISHCLVNHALAVFDLIEKDCSLEIAQLIIRWLKENRFQDFTFRKCQRKFRRYKKDSLRSGIDLLKEHEYLKEWQLKPEAGRPSDVFDVNPHLYE